MESILLPRKILQVGVGSEQGIVFGHAEDQEKDLDPGRVCHRGQVTVLAGNSAPAVEPFRVEQKMKGKSM